MDVGAAASVGSSGVSEPACLLSTLTAGQISSRHLATSTLALASMHVADWLGSDLFGPEPQLFWTTLQEANHPRRAGSCTDGRRLVVWAERSGAQMTPNM